MDIERAVLNAVKQGVSKDSLTSQVLQLATALGVDDKIVHVSRAETMAQDIAKDLAASQTERLLKQGDRVETEQGAAVAVVLTPEELLRRLSA